MAAALFRRGSGLCVRCIHRELCRVVWRPQAALFSSKPSDGKQPRRTHIKKAKPQPAVDINELLEKLFSQRRPGTASSAAGKARPAKASSVPKPPTTSSATGSTSDVPALSKTKPAVAVFQQAAEPSASSPTNPKISLNVTQALAADSLSNGTVHTTSASPAASEAAVVETVETKAETTTEQLPLTSDLPLSATEVKNVETSSFTAVTVEPLTKTAIETPVESSPHPVEALETGASVVEGPVEPSAQETQFTSTDSGVADVSHTGKDEALIEATKESPVHAVIFPVETLETKATLEGPVEPTIDAVVDDATQEIKAKNAALGEVDVSHTAKEEPLLESAIESPVESGLPPLEALETRASVIEGQVEPAIVTAVDDTTQEVQTNTTESGIVDILQSVKGEPVIETAIESPVESSLPLQSRASVVEGLVEPTIDIAVDITAQAESTDSRLDNVSHVAELEALTETTTESSADVEILGTRAALVEGPVEPTIEVAVDHVAQEVQTNTTNSGNDDISDATTVEPLINTTIELPVETSPPPVETLETTAAAEGAVEPTTEAKADTEVVNSSHNAKEEPLIETMIEPPVENVQESTPLPLKSEVESSSGNVAVDEVKESEQGTLLQMEEVKTSETEAMTLESVTLAEVKAEVGSLESEVLQEACDSLEEEAEKLAKEEKMQVETTAEDADIFEDTSEANMFTLDSISEITDAIEAETSVILEVMFGSEQGPKQPTGTLLDGQDLGPQDEVMGQEAEKELSSVLEAMSLESVTLAEVEASLGSLESESLSETTDYLEKEAEVLAGEERMKVEEGTASTEMTEALNFESLPEVDALTEDLETEELMEELLFTVPHHTMDGQIGQEVVEADSLDAVAETDDQPIPPASPEQEVDEEGASGNDEATGMHTDLDPVQRLFVEKIREYNNMSRLNGGPLEVEPDYIKNLSEEMVKLQRLYGGGDLSGFPQFTFTEPEMDQDSK